MKWPLRDPAPPRLTPHASRFTSWPFRALAFGLASFAFNAGAAGTIKIAVIDPLSGPFANVGESMVRHVQLAIDAVNARGGVLGGTKFELVALDSKSSPQEAQLALKQAIDQGIHFINQTNGS
ncbi:MAG: ABC transporter substrate-binding protein, partial [Burkholderiales bacterium]